MPYLRDDRSWRLLLDRGGGPRYLFVARGVGGGFRVKVRRVQGSGFRARFRAKREQLTGFQGLLSEKHGRNLALTVLYAGPRCGLAG